MAITKKEKMNCKYCKRKIKNPRKDAVTCGRKKCKEEYNRDYTKSEKAMSYNRDYQKISQRAFWELFKRHKREYRKIRKKLMEKKK